MLGDLKGLFSNDIGIDLGTANSLVYVRDRESFCVNPLSSLSRPA